MDENSSNLIDISTHAAFYTIKDITHKLPDLARVNPSKLIQQCENVHITML